MDEKPASEFTWKGRIVWLVIGAIVTAFLGVGVPRIIDAVREEHPPHPDTRISQLVTSDGPLIYVSNVGQAVDKIKIDVTVDPYVIKSVEVSNEEEVKLLVGGPGATHASFTIDELWPGTAHYIQIVTEGNLKLAWTVKGWSIHDGHIAEQIPVIEVK